MSGKGEFGLGESVSLFKKPTRDRTKQIILMGSTIDKGIERVFGAGEEEIREINRFSLELTEERKKFQVVQPDDVRFSLHFVSSRFGKDLYRKA
jgi:hypothetical protein